MITARQRGIPISVQTFNLSIILIEARRFYNTVSARKFQKDSYRKKYDFFSCQNQHLIVIARNSLSDCQHGFSLNIPKRQIASLARSCREHLVRKIKLKWKERSWIPHSQHCQLRGYTCQATVLLKNEIFQVRSYKYM